MHEQSTACGCGCGGYPAFGKRFIRFHHRSGMTTRATLFARLRSKVIRQDGCWGWTDTPNNKGYGVIRCEGKKLGAHRVAWEEATGEAVAEDSYVLHTCDNRICTRNDDAGVYEVNGIIYRRVGHLFLGDSDANIADMVVKGRAYLSAHPELAQRGMGKSQAKLTDNLVIEIKRRLRAGGVTQRELAVEYRIDQSVVSRIHTGKDWAHITAE